MYDPLALMACVPPSTPFLSCVEKEVKGVAYCYWHLKARAWYYDKVKELRLHVSLLRALPSISPLTPNSMLILCTLPSNGGI